MHTYNKIMLNVWLIAGIAITLFVTYMCFTEGVKKWGPYYIFAVTAMGTYFMKKWMMKRMEKHLNYMEEQKETKTQK